jgi:hypothetical protein
MAIIVKDSGGNYPPCPEGLHQAVCVDVVDLPDQETAFGVKDMIQITWQTEDIEGQDKDGNLTGKSQRYLVFRRYNASLNKKSSLYKDLVAWRGRKFTLEELAGFDVEKLIGANCQIQVAHNAKDGGGFYANVQAVVPLSRNANKIQARDFTRKRDRVSDDGPAPDGGSTGDPDDQIPF